MSKEEAAEEALRSRLLGFIQMVSRKQSATLERGDAVFREGDAVDGLYVLASGALQVSEAGRTLGTLAPGEAFGEISLLEGETARTKTVSCASERCEVVSILGRDFLRLVEKSRVVRESFEQLKARRESVNAEQLGKRAQ